MKAMIGVVFLVAMGALLYFGFAAQPDKPVNPSKPGDIMPAEQPQTLTIPAHKKTDTSQTPPSAKSMLSGAVLETMDSGGYTYVQIDTGKGKVWAAGPKITIKVGEKVSIPQGMQMRNYHSKTLNRTFDNVYFVGQILKAGQKAASPTGGMSAGAALPKGHPQVKKSGGKGAQGAVVVGNIKKADGGITIAELFTKRAALSGKSVSIRGKVVKYTPAILGKNWIHIQDGSGGKGTNDLTVTTSGTARVGDTILLKGKVTLNKDFGAGYKYALIIEDAAVTVEK